MWRPVVGDEMIGEGIASQLGTVAIVLLAAGTASRMGEDGPHKLLASFEGVPLVRRMALRAIATASPVVVVTGHRQAEIEAALAGLDIELTYNRDYLSGLSSSIVCGFTAPQIASSNGVLIMLSDMPGISTADLNSLIATFEATGGGSVVRATFGGLRGNPVILPRSLSAAISQLGGDVGARSVIESCGLPIIDVEIGAAAQLDVDTPEAVIAAGGILGS